MRGIKYTLALSLCMTILWAEAQTANDVAKNPYKNQMRLTLNSGEVKYYNTEDVKNIDMQDNSIVITSANSSSADTYTGSVEKLSFARKNDEGKSGNYENVQGKIKLLEAKGWQETLYAKWEPFEGAQSYNVYCNGKLIDKQLVRRYASYVRADVVGLKADTYTLRVVPVGTDGNEIPSAANIVSSLSVINYNREGFAHFKSGSSGIGAYNNDGTLKAGAKVFYVSANTAKTISTTVIIGNGKTQTFYGLQTIINAYQKGYDKTPIAFRIIGLVKKDDLDAVGSSAEGLQIKGKSAYSEMNITIEGIGDDATVHGFGFLLRNASGVELRNFAIMRCMDDCVSIDTDNSMIWVHNMDFFYGPNGGGDHAKGDGTVDIKGDSQYITVAYNRFWDTGKSSLCGMTSESKPNYITYHHNWFDHADSRCPRVRTMSVHVWNNYFDGVAKYGAGATMGASVFVEGNYFRGTAKPILISQQGSDIASDPKGTFSGEAGGIIKSFGNVFAEKPSSFKYVTYQQNATQFDAYETSSRDEQVPQNVTTFKGGTSYDNFDTDKTLMYQYVANKAEDVPTVVTGFYGAGRINHGDFYYDLSGTDNVYTYDATLGAALDNYKSSLLSIYGEGSSSGETGGDNEDKGGSDEGSGDNSGTGDSHTGSILCTFEGNKPSTDMVNVTGNYSTSKGTATIDGITYKTCVKMESSTQISFTLTASHTITLYFADSETASAKVDGTKISGALGNTFTLTLSVGSHTLTKDKSVNLFGIRFVPAE